MSTTHLHQTVGIAGAYEFLRELEWSAATLLVPQEVLALMTDSGIEDPNSALSDFLATNLLTRYGDRIGLSSFGIRTLLLLEAINGGDIKDVYRRLGHYDPTLRAYELVREGMTLEFLRSINNRPGFLRLYFCSPWISLDDYQQALLKHAVLQVERRGVTPEILVIARPADSETIRPPDSLKPFQELGASIFLNRRLHTKLYIREPDQGGGYSMAIVGSQNLTRSTYLELGIRINADGVVIDQVIAYFWELCNASAEV